MVRSMSRKGDRRDHARDEARAGLFPSIEGFHDRRRSHPGLGYLTPEQKAAAFHSAAAAT